METATHNLIFTRTHARSPYMEWAKLCSSAKFNLATSGVANYSLRDLDVSTSDLEINGPSFYGYAPLMEAIAARYSVEKDCVLTAAGTSMANYLAFAASGNPGDEILVEQPAYELLLSAAEYLGLKLVRFRRPRERSFQPDLDELTRKLSSKTKLIVLTNLHNPSGVLLSEEILREIGDVARKFGARVLVDEVYLEMLFRERPPSSFHLDPERFIVTSSLTKAYGLSGVRCGWVLASPELIARMWRINDLHAATPAFPAEQISVVALAKLKKISTRAEALLRTNRQLLREFLNSRDEFDYAWPEYGTIIFPRFMGGNAEDLCVFLREEFEVSVVPGRFFETPDHIRIGVGGETEGVRLALAQLALGLNAFREGRR